MQYLVSFFEGIITFISPCLLPMLPMYVSYFAAGRENGVEKSAVINALGFVCGFTAVFVLLGLFSASLGSLLRTYSRIIEVAAGILTVFFGLGFIGVIKPVFRGGMKPSAVKKAGFFRALLFGIVFSVSWTPCVGAFLGSALALASVAASAARGTLLLLCYSLGLGIPFILAAVLINELENAFAFIKKHYGIINTVCGIFLIAVGLLMIAGIMGRYLGSIG